MDFLVPVGILAAMWSIWGVAILAGKTAEAWGRRKKKRERSLGSDYWLQKLTVGNIAEAASVLAERKEPRALKPLQNILEKKILHRKGTVFLGEFLYDIAKENGILPPESKPVLTAALLDALQARGYSAFCVAKNFSWSDYFYPYWDVYEAVLAALGEIGNPSSIPVIFEVLRNEAYFKRGSVREAAALALGRIGNPEAISELVDQLKKDRFSEFFAFSCAQALGMLGWRPKTESEAIVFSLPFLGQEGLKTLFSCEFSKEDSPGYLTKNNRGEMAAVREMPLEDFIGILAGAYKEEQISLKTFSHAISRTGIQAVPILKQFVFNRPLSELSRLGFSERRKSEKVILWLTGVLKHLGWSPSTDLEREIYSLFERLEGGQESFKFNNPDSFSSIRFVFSYVDEVPLSEEEFSTLGFKPRAVR